MSYLGLANPISIVLHASLTTEKPFLELLETMTVRDIQIRKYMSESFDVQIVHDTVRRERARKGSPTEGVLRYTIIFNVPFIVIVIVISVVAIMLSILFAGLLIGSDSATWVVMASTSTVLRV